MSAPFRNAQPNMSMEPAKRPAPAPRMRRKAQADPLVAKKKTLPKPLTKAKPPPNLPRPKVKNGLDPAKLGQFAAKRAQNGGWSDMPKNVVGEIYEFPLVTTKRALLEGLRHHIMRLHRAENDKPLNLMDPDEFPRPVKLHRRDPQTAPAHLRGVKTENEDTVMAEGEAENERLRQQKAARDAQRDRDLAQIAPVDKSKDPRKRKDKKESAATFYARDSEEHKKKSELRYEETMPWHLEDAEGKAGVWVGQYISALSEVNFALVIENGRFRGVPLERWFKFHEKPRFETMSLEKAESLMSSQQDVKRWMMIDQEKQAREKEKTETSQFLRGSRKLFVKQEAVTSKFANRSERQDDQELDVSGDEFQDDDEAPGFEADDEDTRDAKQRIRREQIGANLFGDGDETVVKKEEDEEEKEKLQRKLFGKQTKKSLRKLEHEMAYDESDSDHDPNNPFAESSESDSEGEEKEEDKEKDEANKGEDAKKGDTETTATATGAGTGPGTGTGPGPGPATGPGPASKGAAATSSGKHKAVDKLKKGKLKRSGSPNLSESSDNESSRKKAKTGKNKNTAGGRSITPLPGRAKAMAGAAAGGDGETSDGGRRVQNAVHAQAQTQAQTQAQKAKPAPTANGSPTLSRAGSRSPNQNAQTAARAASPIANGSGGGSGGGGGGGGSGSGSGGSGSGGGGGNASRPVRQQVTPITPAEIAQYIPEHGISLGGLFKKFNWRVDKPGGTPKPEYMSMIRQVGIYNSDDRLIKPKKRE